MRLIAIASQMAYWLDRTRFLPGPRGDIRELRPDEVDRLDTAIQRGERLSPDQTENERAAG